MAKNQFLGQAGVKIKYPDHFFEEYDRSLNIRKYGVDNLYPQHLRDFFEVSPTFNSCATRLKDFLYGEGSQSKLLTNQIVTALLQDYAIFGGFALFVGYNGLGDIDYINYVPFETIRLGEQGVNGLYTYCYYSPDWSEHTTVNKKKVAIKDKIKYWMFTDNIETRLSRMTQEDYAGGEILYFSNTISYPTEHIRAVINYVSQEIGISNILYRDVRCNFMPATALAIPRQSDEDTNELMDNISKLQGDENSFKILTISFSSQEDKPEALNLSGQDYMDRVLKASENASKVITKAYHQESFMRLEDGSLGFGSDAISEIYNFYNFQLRTTRSEIETVLKKLDPAFSLIEIKFT